MKLRRLPATLLVLALFLAEPANAAAQDSAEGFQHFITRDGGRPMDGPKEFRFIGANMPGLVLPYDWTLYLPERLQLPSPWEQEDAFKTLDQMNLRVVRLWNLPIRNPKEKPADGAMTWHSSALGIILSFGFLTGAFSPLVLSRLSKSFGLDGAIASLSIVHLTAGLIVVVATYTTFWRDLQRNQQLEEVSFHQA